MKKYINKIKEWYENRDDLFKALCMGCSSALGFIGMTVLLLAIVMGCVPESRKCTPAETAPAAPIVQPVILTPGQTAMLLEPVQAIARVPFQGGKLYEGPVMFQKGSMVVKPRAE